MADIAFSHSMPCSLRDSALFEWLRETLRDTDLSPQWPRHLNRVRIPTLRTGEHFEAEYRMSRISTKLPYVVAEFFPGRGFIYEPAPAHPFRGRIQVSVEASLAGSILQWSGVYHTSFWRPERAFFRYYFEPRFFAHLEDGLRSLDSK